MRIPSQLKSNLLLPHSVSPSSVTLHSGPWTLSAAAVFLRLQDVQQGIPLLLRKVAHKS